MGKLDDLQGLLISTDSDFREARNVARQVAEVFDSGLRAFLDASEEHCRVMPENKDLKEEFKNPTMNPGGAVGRGRGAYTFATFLQVGGLISKISVSVVVPGDQNGRRAKVTVGNDMASVVFNPPATDQDLVPLFEGLYLALSKEYANRYQSWTQGGAYQLSRMGFVQEPTGAQE